MRIIGGRFRGTRLSAPGPVATHGHLRPTSDRVREAVFNLLAHGSYGEPAPPEGRRVLDLFAGTGALGLEALSRGASFAVFVEDHPASRALIRENVERLRLTGQTKIWRRDATRLGPCRGASAGSARPRSPRRVPAAGSRRGLCSCSRQRWRRSRLRCPASSAPMSGNTATRAC
jgi:16S rRNA (guanine(966)-N(2))-methyltransferase RsmD